jgi:hypothetical protein
MARIGTGYRRKNRANPGVIRGTQTLAGVRAGRQGGPRTAQAVQRFEKSTDFVTGDFVGNPNLRVGSLGVQTTTGTYWSCTNAGTAAWQKIGLQT